MTALARAKDNGENHQCSVEALHSSSMKISRQFRHSTAIDSEHDSSRVATRERKYRGRLMHVQISCDLILKATIRFYLASSLLFSISSTFRGFIPGTKTLYLESPRYPRQHPPVLHISSFQHELIIVCKVKGYMMKPKMCVTLQKSCTQSTRVFTNFKKI